MEMTMYKFMQTMLDAFPQAEVGTDNDGQLVIYTNLREAEDGMVVPFDD